MLRLQRNEIATTVVGTRLLYSEISGAFYTQNNSWISPPLAHFIGLKYWWISPHLLHGLTAHLAPYFTGHYYEQLNINNTREGLRSSTLQLIDYQRIPESFTIFIK